MESPQVLFKQVVSRGCGLDVHKKVVVATIEGEGIKKQTQEFGTVTSSLKELRDWLLEYGVTHVVMESTGVFWKPVYNVLEPVGLTVCRYKADRQTLRWQRNNDAGCRRCLSQKAGGQQGRYQ